MEIRELRAWAQTLPREQFRAQLGPFVLVEKPPAPLLQQAAMLLVASRTLGMAHRDRLADEILTMLHGFDSLVVCSLPPLGDQSEIRVGRSASCDLTVDEPSVSKVHAVVRWDAAQGGCSVQDLGSSNGTYVNAAQLDFREERLLLDGDVISFGDAQFMYFDTDSLHAQLATPGGAPLR